MSSGFVEQPTTREGRERYGQELRALRERMGLSRDQLAVAVGVSSKTIQHVELGYQNLGKAARTRVSELAGEAVEEGEGVYRLPEPEERPKANAEDVIARVVRLAINQSTRRKAEGVAQIMGIELDEAMRLVVRYELEHEGEEGETSMGG